MQSVEPVLENAIKTLQKVVDVRGMGKKLLIQLPGDDQMIQVGDDVSGDVSKDVDPLAVAKAGIAAKAAKEADSIVAKQGAAMDKANKAALDNVVTSPVDPKLLKKAAEKAAKEEEKALKDKETAAEEEEKVAKKLVDEGTKALKALQTDAEKKTPGSKAAAPVDRDGKPVKCKAAAADADAKEEKKDDDKDAKKDDKKDDKKDEKKWASIPM